MSAVEKVIDERLLIEAAQHDPGRFAELYEASFARVYAFIRRRVRDRDLAEDLTSEGNSSLRRKTARRSQCWWT